MGPTYNPIFMNFYHSTNENILILKIIRLKEVVLHNNEYLLVTIALKNL